MTQAVKEIRSILLGRTKLTDDGKIAMRVPGEFALSYGVADGASAIRFLGVARRSAAYTTKSSKKNVMKAATVAMSNIGRGVVLNEQPDTVACLIRYVLTKPVLLSFRFVDEIPVLTVWSARTVTGLLSLRRAIRAFEKELPKNITRSEEAAPVDPLLQKEKKKKEKKKKAGKTAETENAAVPAEENAEPAAEAESEPVPAEEYAEPVAETESETVTAEENYEQATGNTGPDEETDMAVPEQPEEDGVTAGNQEMEDEQ